MSEEAKNKITMLLKSGNIGNINLVEALISDDNRLDYMFCVGVISKYVIDKLNNDFNDGGHFKEVITAFCTILDKLFCANNFNRVSFHSHKHFTVYCIEFIYPDKQEEYALFCNQFTDFIESRVDFYKRLYEDFGSEIIDYYNKEAF
jgi:hypothetical protein